MYLNHINNWPLVSMLHIFLKEVLNQHRDKNSIQNIMKRLNTKNWFQYMKNCLSRTKDDVPQLKCLQEKLNLKVYTEL